ncbi:MAG: 50S ribosomal protein L37ae [Candidatus Iainarchaeum archaeon]|uniref:Large ribosomal subunit protein eL43 n=1 Tax=Candidatus Iainarchaeum sp. TaxID=3101447 RepID=A0A497JI77_9ARCH|nr:MAG: 50S ribosomal protein L37ae [Candidatus Diapherotrites archaeon]
MTTKKVKYAGRFGSRYGVGIRRRVNKVEEKQRKKFVCPNCFSESVKRVGNAIFLCKKCNVKFAGGAYYPETLQGGIVKRMVSQRQFLPLMEELLTAKELEEKGIEEAKAEGAE